MVLFKTYIKKETKDIKKEHRIRVVSEDFLCNNPHTCFIDPEEPGELLKFFDTEEEDFFEAISIRHDDKSITEFWFNEHRLWQTLISLSVQFSVNQEVARESTCVWNFFTITLRKVNENQIELSIEYRAKNLLVSEMFVESEFQLALIKGASKYYKTLVSHGVSVDYHRKKLLKINDIENTYEKQYGAN